MAKKDKFPEHFWNHRVVRQTVARSETESETSLAIHEAHYTASKSKKVPELITMDPVGVWGETKAELKSTLKRMLKSLDKPVLEYTKYVKKPKKTGLTSEEKEIVRDGVEAYLKYADGYIVFQKVRSGQTELTEDEKKIVPLVVAMKELLGIK